MATCWAFFLSLCGFFLASVKLIMKRSKELTVIGNIQGQNIVGNNKIVSFQMLTDFS